MLSGFKKHFSLAFLLCASMIALSAVSGCSGGREEEQATPTVSQKTSSQSADVATSPQSPQEVVNPTTPTQRAPKTIDGVPLDVWPDVWFDDPLAIASSGVTVDVGNLKTSETKLPTASKEQTDSPPVKAANSAARDWTIYVSDENIQREVKDIRLTLKQAFQSVQRYNGHYKQVQVDGQVLAVLATIAGEHPVTFSWKRQGPHVRDLSASLAEAAQGLGRKYYTPASSIYDQVDQLLDGNAPGNLKPSSPQRAFEDFADRGALMKRMQRAEDWMKTNAGDEKGFQAEADQLGHESSLIALLTVVSSSSGYDLTDEPEYATQSEALIRAVLDVRKAAEQQDFAAFTDARERMKKACTACHLDFRFDDE